MKKYFLLVFLAINSFLVYAQVKQGEILIGGTGDDIGSSIIQTNDGGYAIVGYTDSYGAGNYDVYVIKLNSKDSIQWTKTIGGTNDDEGSSIFQTSDDGYIITGYTLSYVTFSGDYEIYIIKLDFAGNLLWTKTISTGTGYQNLGYSIIETKDGGYSLTGSSEAGAWGPSMYTIRLDATGNIKWARSAGGTSTWDQGNSIIQNNKGGYVIAGTLSNQVGVIELDSMGNNIWGKVIADRSFSTGNSIKQTKDKGYIIAGSTYYSDTTSFPNDIYVIKLDSAGNVKWMKTVGGDSNDVGNSIIQTLDGGYAIAGFTNSYGAGGYDVYVLKLDSVGNIIWTKTVGGKGNDYGNSIIQTNDGGYAIAGYTDSYGAGGYDVYVITLDSIGSLCSATGSGGSITTIDSGKISTAASSVDTASIEVIDSGRASSGAAYNEICILEGIDNISRLQSNIAIFPNPNNGVFTIQISNSQLQIANSKIEIYNIIGERIFEETLRQAQGDNTINLSNEAKGLYLYRLLTPEGKPLAQGKFIIQ